MDTGSLGVRKPWGSLGVRAHSVIRSTQTDDEITIYDNASIRIDSERLLGNGGL